MCVSKVAQSPGRGGSKTKVTGLFKGGWGRGLRVSEGFGWLVFVRMGI